MMSSYSEVVDYAEVTTYYDDDLMLHCKLEGLVSSTATMPMDRRLLQQWASSAAAAASTATATAITVPTPSCRMNNVECTPNSHASHNISLLHQHSEYEDEDGMMINSCSKIDFLSGMMGLTTSTSSAGRRSCMTTSTKMVRLRSNSQQKQPQPMSLLPLLEETAVVTSAEEPSAPSEQQQQQIDVSDKENQVPGQCRPVVEEEDNVGGDDEKYQELYNLVSALRECLEEREYEIATQKAVIAKLQEQQDTLHSMLVEADAENRMLREQQQEAHQESILKDGPAVGPAKSRQPLRTIFSDPTALVVATPPGSKTRSNNGRQFDGDDVDIMNDAEEGFVFEIALTPPSSFSQTTRAAVDETVMTDGKQQQELQHVPVQLDSWSPHKDTVQIPQDEWQQINMERTTALIRAGDLAYQLANIRAELDELKSTSASSQQHSHSGTNRHLSKCPLNQQQRRGGGVNRILVDSFDKENSDPYGGTTYGGISMYNNDSHNNRKDDEAVVIVQVPEEEWESLVQERDTAIQRAGELATKFANTRAENDELQERLNQTKLALHHCENDIRMLLKAQQTYQQSLLPTPTASTKSPKRAKQNDRTAITPGTQPLTSTNSPTKRQHHRGGSFFLSSTSYTTPIERSKSTAGRVENNNNGISSSGSGGILSSIFWSHSSAAVENAVGNNKAIEDSHEAIEARYVSPCSSPWPLPILDANTIAESRLGLYCDDDEDDNDEGLDRTSGIFRSTCYDNIVKVPLADQISPAFSRAATTGYDDEVCEITDDLGDAEDSSFVSKSSVHSNVQDSAIAFAGGLAQQLASSKATADELADQLYMTQRALEAREEELQQFYNTTNVAKGAGTTHSSVQGLCSPSTDKHNLTAVAAMTTTVLRPNHSTQRSVSYTSPTTTKRRGSYWGSSIISPYG